MKYHIFIHRKGVNAPFIEQTGNRDTAISTAEDYTFDNDIVKIFIKDTENNKIIFSYKQK